MSAPALPRRTPGLAGNEFEQLAPPDAGTACFECGRRAPDFLISTTRTGYLGGKSSHTFKLCEPCASPVALSLVADDVVVVITRLPKDRIMSQTTDKMEGRA